jgi:hypothetical protein
MVAIAGADTCVWSGRAVINRTRFAAKGPWAAIRCWPAVPGHRPGMDDTTGSSIAIDPR